MGCIEFLLSKTHTVYFFRFALPQNVLIIVDLQFWRRIFRADHRWFLEPWANQGKAWPTQTGAIRANPWLSQSNQFCRGLKKRWVSNLWAKTSNDIIAGDGRERFMIELKIIEIFLWYCFIFNELYTLTALLSNFKWRTFY